MVSDEIEGMRAAGRTDAETASLLSDATGLPTDEAALRRFFAGPENRRRG